MAADDQTFRVGLAIVVVVFGVVFLIGLFLFGNRLFERKGEEFFFANICKIFGVPIPQHNWLIAWLEGVLSSYDQYLDKRNEFWEYFGQVALAAVIVVVLAVLLLTKVISAEAGLPILSAVAGFAIAKTSGGQLNRRPSQLPNHPDSDKQ